MNETKVRIKAILEITIKYGKKLIINSLRYHVGKTTGKSNHRTVQKKSIIIGREKKSKKCIYVYLVFGQENAIQIKKML